MKLFFAAILMLPLLCVAEVYKCQKEGKTSFSDKPCTSGSKESTVDIRVTPAVTKQEKTESDLTGKELKPEEIADKKRRNLDKQVKTRLINDEIFRAEARMRQLNLEMEKELAILKQSKGGGNNALVSATRDNAIANEMQAVTAKYANKIAVEKSEVDRLQKERDSIRNE